VNFSRPWESISGPKPDIVEDVHVQQPPSGSNDSLPLLNQSGLELKENICVDGQWRIECCLPKSTIQCFALQKTMTFKCKVRINIYKLVNGTPPPCYSSFWVEYHSEPLEHHKH